MRIGIIGAGNIGGNIARRLALAGHEVTISFARDQAKLAALAAETGATVGDPSRAATAEVVVLSVPWGVIDQALAAAGPLAGKVVVDTTNQFGPGGAIDLGHTAARHNADRLPGARYTKCFNTLTAGFQPVDLGGIDQCAVMEAPRRPGAVYGEEYRAADAAAVVAAVRAGRPIPPTPRY